MGVDLKAPNPLLQSSIPEEEISKIIKLGKGKSNQLTL